MIHPEKMTQVIGRIPGADEAYCGLTIPASALIVLAVSFGLALVYEKVWNYMEKRWQVSHRLTDLLLPEK